MTWTGPIPQNCDVCRSPITTGGFGDVVIPPQLGGNGHSWGIVCPKCALRCTFGTGKGQMYDKTGNKVKAVTETRIS